MRWTEEEVTALARGVEAFGEGKWKDIQKSNKLLQGRNAIQLKDKWRNIQKVVNSEVDARTQQFHGDLLGLLRRLCMSKSS